MIRKARKHFSIWRDIIREEANADHRKTLFKNYAKWYLYNRPLGIRTETTLVNGFKAYVYPDSDSDVSNLFSKNVDRLDTLFIRKHLSTGDLIVDAGCKMGNHTLALADIIGGAILIDSSARSLERAKENLQFNHLTLDRFEFVEAPVGDLITVDSVIEKHGWPKLAFIKTNTETHGVSVLKGCEKTIRRCDVKMVRFVRWSKIPLAEFHEFFAKIGWKIFTLDNDGLPSQKETVLDARDSLFAVPLAFRIHGI